MENWLENLLENLLENWMENMLEIWMENLLEKMVGNLVGKCWLNIWLEKLLVNGCEIIGEKIVATNLPLRAPTTMGIYYRFLL